MLLLDVSAKCDNKMFVQLLIPVLIMGFRIYMHLSSFFYFLTENLGFTIIPCYTFSFQLYGNEQRVVLVKYFMKAIEVSLTQSPEQWLRGSWSQCCVSLTLMGCHFSYEGLQLLYFALYIYLKHLNNIHLFYILLQIVIVCFTEIFLYLLK